MKINSNILSLSALRALSNTTKALARSMERLASGKRVNFARDDAASLAIGSGLEAQRRGILQSIRNVNDAYGSITTADSAMTAQSELLLRMRDIALMASNGTLSNKERDYLHSEFQSLIHEVDRIAHHSEINNVSLLDGSFKDISIRLGMRREDSFSFGLSATRISDLFSVTSASIVGTGTFQSRSTYPSDASPEFVQIVDLNKDGNLDLVSSSANRDTMSISLGNGDGTFQSRKTVLAALPATSTIRLFSSGDLNKDGNLDLVVSDYDNGTVNLLFGNGDGTFLPVQTLGVAAGYYATKTADLNKDGNLDIITSELGGLFSVFLGNGDGSFQNRVTVSGGASSYSLQVEDLNNDGNLDLITSNVASRTVSYVLGNGDGTFQSVRTIPADTDSYGLTIADFNSDGALDIVTASNSRGTLSLSLGNGNGTFQARVTFVSSGGPFMPAAADLNGDGNMDLLSPDSSDDTISIFLGNGDGTFQSRITESTGDGPQTIAMGDLNKDGVIDLAVTDRSGGTISVFLAETAIAHEAQSYPSVETQIDAENALSSIDQALALLYTYRADLGALQNRIGYAEASLLITYQNISQAHSEIIEADYSVEIAEWTRLHLLEKIGLSVSVHANTHWNLVMNLMRAI